MYAVVNTIWTHAGFTVEWNKSLGYFDVLEIDNSRLVQRYQYITLAEQQDSRRRAVRLAKELARNYA